MRYSREIKRTAALAAILQLLPLLGLAQDYVDRNYYGQRLEPVNRIMHGVGQDPGTNGGYSQPFFTDYVSEMDSTEYPMVYMYYESLQNIGTDWAIKLREKLLPYQDKALAIQFGLYLVNQTEAVAAGNLDDDIGDWLDGIHELGLPVYVRIGYEFNGPWNGYPVESYKNAFRHITNKIREREDLEIATVWNLAAEGNTSFMPYYPGDDYVDWWGVNVFLKEDFDRQLTIDYLDSAEVYQKPVMIGESTPKFVGVTTGQTAWDVWFDPYFDWIATEPGIKMLNYINWEWAAQTIDNSWVNWGDARLGTNGVVAQNYRDEMNDSLYQHAASDKAFRSSLGFNENIVPDPVTGLRITQDEFPIRMEWDQAQDTSGIARYQLYDNDERYSFTGKSGFTFREMLPGDSLNISITVIDRAGNESNPSESIQVVLPESVAGTNIIKNGSFDAGQEFWVFQVFAANATGSFNIDAENGIEGNSARLNVSQSTGTNFHLLLEQGVDLIPGHEYRITYKAKADRQAQMETWLQQQTGNFFYAQETVNIDTTVQTFSDIALIPSDHNTGQNMFLRFMIGNSGIGDIWIDDVKLEDLGFKVSNEIDLDVPESFKLYNAYPNPFNPSTTIKYKVSKSDRVQIDVFNVIGHHISSLVNQVHPVGEHQVVWDASKNSSGVYLVRMLFDGASSTQKIVLLK